MFNVDPVASSSSHASFTPREPRDGIPLLIELERVLSASPEADLARVARALGLSKRSLQRALVRAGSSFNALRTHIRLTRAEALLAVQHTKVSGVAGDVGFASTGHFILWFRRHRGMTPGAWRARKSDIEGGVQ